MIDLIFASPTCGLSKDPKSCMIDFEFWVADLGVCGACQLLHDRLRRRGRRDRL